MRHLRLAFVTPLAVLLLSMGVAAPAGAATSRPVNIRLANPANGGSCPPADFVVSSAVSPGGPAQVFLVVPPGPPGCPADGLDMTITPGVVGAPPGQAVALPLTAASCQAGTELIDSQITALGQTPGVGIGSGPPGGVSSPCANGDTAYAQLQADIAGLVSVGGGFYYFFRHSDGGHVLVVGGAAGIAALAGVYDDSTGTPLGVFVVSWSGSPPALYGLQPSGTVGVATVVCAFCPG